MSKAKMMVSIISQQPLSELLIPVMGNDIEYTITDSWSMVRGKLERSCLIEYHDISQPLLKSKWETVHKILVENSQNIGIREEHCAYLRWQANDFAGCICEFFGHQCPKKGICKKIRYVN